MKNTLLEKRSQSLLSAARKGIVAAIALLSLGALTASAEIVVVEAGPGGQHTDWVTRSGTWATSSGHVTVEGATASANTYFFGNLAAKMTVAPVLSTAGGTYVLDLAYPTTSAAVTNHGVGIRMTDCTGLPDFSTAPTVGYGKWNNIGTLVLDSGKTTPSIEFFWPTNVNGTPSSFFSDRIFITCLRFTQVSPCTNTASLGQVRTPLVENQLWVDVPGVANGATAVHVYRDMGFGWEKIGSKTSGVSQGLNRVTTSALVRDDKICATQVVGAYESCLPPTGPKVGSGANPRIRVNFVVSHDTTLTGPVGAPSSASSFNKWTYVGSMSLLSGFLSAPSGGTVIDPSVIGPCWQTISLHPLNDLTCVVDSGAAGTSVPAGTFGAFVGISLANDSQDSGPYNIYIDNIMNGTNVIEDFENTRTNTTGMFSKPSSWTTTSANVMSAQNYSLVVATNADTGNRCANVFWQFSDNASGAFFNLIASGTNGVNYPQIDMSQPITARILVLGPGTNVNEMTIGQPPTFAGVQTNGTYIFDGTATGVGPFTYQWSKNGAVLSNGGKISGATAAKLTVSNVTGAELGYYSVTVTSDSSCSPVSSHPSQLAWATNVAPDKITISAKTATSVTFTWTNGILQSATDMKNTNNVWTDVTPATPPVTIPTTNGTKFYRLR